MPLNEDHAMQHKQMRNIISSVALCCAVTATTALAQSLETPRNVTFELTSLTRNNLPLQHGVQNYITLSMVEIESSKAVSIADPPPFPLIATLAYHDDKGQERKVRTSYAYRC